MEVSQKCFDISKFGILTIFTLSTKPHQSQNPNLTFIFHHLITFYPKLFQKFEDEDESKFLSDLNDLIDIEKEIYQKNNYYCIKKQKNKCKFLIYLLNFSI